MRVNLPPTERRDRRPPLPAGACRPGERRECAVIVALDWDGPRVAAAVVLVVTLATLVFAVVVARRPRPIRPGFDIARLVVSMLTVTAMALVVGVALAAVWVIVAIAGGVLLGVAQGWSTTVSWSGGQPVGRRSVAGLVLWSVGVLVMQGAGLVARTGAVRVGQAISWFGVGTLAGLIASRHRRVLRSRPAVAVAVVACGTAALCLGGTGGARAQSGEWALIDTRVGVSAEPAPAEWEVLVSATAMTVVKSFGPDDPSGAEAMFAASWTPPPERLESGALVTIPVTVFADHSGNRDTQYFLGLDVIMLVDGGWNSQAVSAGVGCAQTTVISGVYECTPAQTTVGELTTDVPFSGERLTIAVSALNCGPACMVEWEYQFETAPTDPGGAVPPEGLPPDTASAPGDSGPVDSGSDRSDSEPGSQDRDEDQTVSGQLDGADTAVTSSAAIGQAIGGLIAAVAIGLISAAEAGMLISSILGAGPLTPAAAAAAIDEVFTPRPTPVQPSVPPAPGSRPAPQVRATAPGLPPPAPAVASATSPHRDGVPRPDPCAAVLANYRDSLRRWTDLQHRIQVLENEYWALTMYVETEAAADFLGAAAYLATLGLDTHGGPDPAAATLDRLAATFEQNLRRSVMAQVLQAAALGEEIDPDAVARNALGDALGTSALAKGGPTQAAFGAFVQQCLAGLVARVAGSSALATVAASIRSGALDAATAANIEAQLQQSFANDVAPLFVVGFKAFEVWQKNREWGEGVERRNRLRNYLVELNTRIHELAYDRDTVGVVRDADRTQLAECREEHA